MLVPQISSSVVIMTREELKALETAAFKRGVERGRFEERCDRNSSPPGKVGHSGATESTGSVSSDAAVRPANS
jgi:hypothetical protein